MKNVNLPDSYDPEKLKAAMQELHSRALQRNKKEEMSFLVGIGTSFEDAFNGFVTHDGRLWLCFHYNVGKDTRAVHGRFDIN